MTDIPESQGDQPKRRRRPLTTAEKINALRKRKPDLPIKDVAAAVGVSERTVNRHFSQNGARQAHYPCVYFAERHGFVKIGTTLNLHARISSLNRGDSAIPGMVVDQVTILAVMPGGQSVERAVHALFAHLRYAGEWFIFDGPLVPFVKAIAEAREATAKENQS